MYLVVVLSSGVSSRLHILLFQGVFVLLLVVSTIGISNPIVQRFALAQEIFVLVNLCINVLSVGKVGETRVLTFVDFHFTQLLPSPRTLIHEFTK